MVQHFVGGGNPVETEPNDPTAPETLTMSQANADGSTSYLNAVTFPLDGSYHPNAAGQKSGYLAAFNRGLSQ